MSPPRRYSRKRSVVSFDRAQTGDVTTRDSAGGDIYHEGADAGDLLHFLRDYVFEADQQRETTIKAVGRELALTRMEMGIISDAVRTVRDRLDDDDKDRDERRKELDRQLTIQRRWLAALTLAVLVSLAVLAVLIWREAGVFALRAAYDAAGPAMGRRG